MLGEYLGVVDLQLICVERDLLEGLLDFDIHDDGALVREFAAELDIVEAYGVVLWLDAESLFKLRIVENDCMGSLYLAGKMSRSDAISAAVSLDGLAAKCK